MSMVTVMLASMAGLMLTPADSAEGVTETRLPISYAREELLTDDGVRRVRQEIARSARVVCSESGSLFNRFSRETRQCVATAYADGLAQLELKVAEARNASRNFAQAELDEEAVTQ